MAARKKEGVERLAQLAAEFRAEAGKIAKGRPDLSSEIDLAVRRVAEAEMWIASAAGRQAEG